MNEESKNDDEIAPLALVAHFSLTLVSPSPGSRRSGLSFQSNVKLCTMIACSESKAGLSQRNVWQGFKCEERSKSLEVYHDQYFITSILH